MQAGNAFMPGMHCKQIWQSVFAGIAGGHCKQESEAFPAVIEGLVDRLAWRHCRHGRLALQHVIACIAGMAGKLCMLVLQARQAGIADRRYRHVFQAWQTYFWHGRQALKAYKVDIADRH
jgi:hypothetical protein